MNMVERLVNVLDSRGSTIHTYPITLQDPAGSDAEFRAKALEAAAHGQLVPDDELDGLSAEMHISRGGHMQPYGDRVDCDSETKAGLEQEVRDRAYLLWEQDGRPEGRSEVYWSRALEQHLSDRSYVRWQQEGSPSGTADADWHRLKEFEAH
jgi:hypothetical protein